MSVSKNLIIALSLGMSVLTALIGHFYGSGAILKMLTQQFLVSSSVMLVFVISFSPQKARWWNLIHLFFLLPAADSLFLNEIGLNQKGQLMMLVSLFLICVDVLFWSFSEEEKKEEKLELEEIPKEEVIEEEAKYDEEDLV